MRHLRRILVVAVVAGASLLGVAPVAEADGSATTRVVEIAVGETGFAAPARQPAGAVTFRVTTTNDLTAVGLIRLHRDVPLERVLDNVRKVFDDDRTVQVAAGRAIQRDADQLGTAVLDPGTTVTLTATLRPGRYYLVDYHRVYENAPGSWVRPLDVVDRGDVGSPEVVATVVLGDSRFYAPARIRAGAPIRFVNLADQPNEAVLMGVPPGTTRADLVAYFTAVEAGEWPPYPFTTGATGMGPIGAATSAIASSDLPPGTYALITWFPNFDNTRMLAAEGMVSLITLT